MLDAIFDRFMEASPLSVMIRGLMERVFATEAIERIFAENAKVQYTRELLFSSVVELMSLVLKDTASHIVCGIHPSVNAAYRAKAQELNVSRTAVYDKLNGIEPFVSEAIVRETAIPLASLINFVEGTPPQLLKGYPIRILDGNCLATTDHRLEVLRTIGAGALPGKSIVVLDPQLRLAINIFTTEDGHAQERSLFNQVLATVSEGELWIGDRNMCTVGFLLGLHRKGASFVIREHKSMPWNPLTTLQANGRVETGELFEQTVQITQTKESLVMRRVVLKLKKPTRNGEQEIAIFTPLPPDVATSAVVAELYRGRRSVENLFQTVTKNYECEIQSLGYPKASLFSFCLALVAYNILATVRAVIISVHGVGDAKLVL